MLISFWVSISFRLRVDTVVGIECMIYKQTMQDSYQCMLLKSYVVVAASCLPGGMLFLLLITKPWQAQFTHFSNDCQEVFQQTLCNAGNIAKLL